MNAPDVTVGVSEFPIQVPWTPLKLGDTRFTVLVFEPGGALIAQSEATVTVKSAQEAAQPLTGTVEAIRPSAEITFTEPVAGAQVRTGDMITLRGMAAGAFIARLLVTINGEAYASLSAPDSNGGVSEFPLNVP